MHVEIKTFPLSLTIPFHKAIKEAARKNETSINKYIMSAIRTKLDKED